MRRVIFQFSYEKSPYLILYFTGSFKVLFENKNWTSNNFRLSEN